MLSSFPLQHDDYVLDLAFDFYGKRLATCSADQKIRIWEKKQKSMAAWSSQSNTNMQSAEDPEANASHSVVEWELVDELSKS
jgi:WD40 repeat protein